MSINSSLCNWIEFKPAWPLRKHPVSLPRLLMYCLFLLLAQTLFAFFQWFSPSQCRFPGLVQPKATHMLMLAQRRGWCSDRNKAGKERNCLLGSSAITSWPWACVKLPRESCTLLEPTLLLFLSVITFSTPIPLKLFISSLKLKAIKDAWTHSTL